MTIEVIVDGVSYTFTCSMQGDIIGVWRTDEEQFDLKERIRKVLKNSLEKANSSEAVNWG